MALSSGQFSKEIKLQFILKLGLLSGLEERKKNYEDEDDRKSRPKTGQYSFVAMFSCPLQDFDRTGIHPLIPPHLPQTNH